jgi:beta-galactosidase/beta-glucuronidase
MLDLADELGFLVIDETPAVGLFFEEEGLERRGILCRRYVQEIVIRYIELLRQKPYVIGEHIWNLCDFKTSQGITRMGGMNYKGVFTRDRRLKLAAHRIREIWDKSGG